MSAHIETRRKLKDMSLVADFEDVLSRCMLSDEDKAMLRMHYIQQESLAFIGDKLGYTERTMKARHKAALKKLADAL